VATARELNGENFARRVSPKWEEETKKTRTSSGIGGMKEKVDLEWESEPVLRGS
jgi:hypothetical protein